MSRSARRRRRLDPTRRRTGNFASARTGHLDLASTAVFARVAIALIAALTGAVGPALADERPADARPVDERSAEDASIEDLFIEGRVAVDRVAADRSAADRSIGTRPPDALGASRLFFTAEERYAATHGGSEGLSGRPAVATDGLPGEERGPGTGQDRRTRHPARSREPDGATGADRSEHARAGESSPRGIVFQALLHVDTRTQVVLDGQLCRAQFPANGGAASGLAPLSLRCTEMPAGVQAVQLLRAERRLLITLSGGERRRLALGESVTSR